MQKHSCKTYFVFLFDFNWQKNLDVLCNEPDCQPEQNGIYNKDEVEHAIMSTLGVKPVFNRYLFEIGCNDAYSVNVSDMIRVTIKELMGKEQEIINLKRRFRMTTCLRIVPYIVADSQSPNQCLSLDNDIIEFLYKSGTAMDLDYYVV